MQNCKPAVTPMETGTKLSKYDEGSYIDPTLYKRLFGSLMYLTTDRPDIMFAVSIISKFMEASNNAHWQQERES